MPVEPQDPTPSDAQSINAQASVLMKQGIRLMADPEPEAVGKAIRCFDDALELRLRLPVGTVPLFGYGLAACWLNRADALVRLADPARMADALHSYDQGIAVLRKLPLCEDPRFPRRLAVAHQNRALALQIQAQAGSPAAIAGFTEAIAVLDQDYSRSIADRAYLQAVVWMNLANARLSETTAESWSCARDAAVSAMSLVAGSEEADADAAEVGLKARHVLCHTIAQRLSLIAAGEDTPAEEVHQATDIADEGLALARRWEQKGVIRFRPLAYDLFRFGARVYARYQPQFLDEFIADNLDPARSSTEYVESPEMRSAAEEARALVERGR